MAEIINLKSFNDRRGCLTVIENEVPFDVKRVFYIYNVDDSIRGGHRHHKTIQAAVCIKGTCKIFNNDGIKEKIFELNSPEYCLILKPEDWHQMYEFSNDAVLLVLASEKFDPLDYIYERYE